MQPDTQAPVLTVSQLTQAIKLCLEGTFTTLWLQGEVSNCKLQSSGHLYFSLKDANAQISAVMFQREASQLKIPLRDGQQIMVRGEISVYAPGGRYQLLVRELRPVGLGELLLKLEELKIKLHRQGWFKPERKRPIPKFPKTIGVVTSPTGAAIQDMLNILTRRCQGFHLILNPVKVQGEGAAQEIAQAIRQFNEHQLADVLIVGRGGGSIEDLWAFNEEVVAEAIFNSRIPIISAVGHETDHCIADYVADLRAPTPSAAAEIVSAERVQIRQHLKQLEKHIGQSLRHRIIQDKHRLEGLRRQPVLASPYGILSVWIQKLDDLRQGLDRSIQTRLSQIRLQLQGRRHQLAALNPVIRILHSKQLLKQKEELIERAWHRQFDAKKQNLSALKRILSSIDPKNLLQKGYCILFSEKEHCAITSVRQIASNQKVALLLADGELKATVTEVIPK